MHTHRLAPLCPTHAHHLRRTCVFPLVQPGLRLRLAQLQQAPRRLLAPRPQIAPLWRLLRARSRPHSPRHRSLAPLPLPLLLPLHGPAARLMMTEFRIWCTTRTTLTMTSARRRRSCIRRLAPWRSLRGPRLPPCRPASALIRTTSFRAWWRRTPAATKAREGPPPWRHWATAALGHTHRCVGLNLPLHPQRRLCPLWTLSLSLPQRGSSSPRPPGLRWWPP